MRRDDLEDGPVDAPVREDLPEREDPTRPERAVEDERSLEGAVEREAPEPATPVTGVESAPDEPDRAGLVP